MEDAELNILLREAKTNCQECFKASREKLPAGAIRSPSREQLAESALGNLQKVLAN
jgi:hypothetical protein